MTLSKCVHLQATGEGADAKEVRRLVATLAGDVGGVWLTSLGLDLLVNENATPDMNVRINPGRVFMVGDEFTTQGLYFGESDTIETRAVAPADPSNPRKDRVYAYVEDAVDGAGPGDFWELGIVEGTPAASPVEPALPANAEELALIDVPAGATSITNSNITDRRTPWPAEIEWSSWTPTLAGWSKGNASFTAEYVKFAGTVFVELEIGAGSTTTFGAALDVSLPVAAANVAHRLGCIGAAAESGGSIYPITGTIISPGTNVRLFAMGAGATHVTQDNNGLQGSVPFAWGTGDTIECSFFYQAA